MENIQIAKKRITRTKICDRILPDYTRGEEIFNMVSHIVGGAFAIAALVICVVVAVSHGNSWGIASGIVYGVTMIILYTMSSIYHGLTKKNTAKKVFQIIDHCAIFLLIAGTYTPIMLSGVREVNPILAWLIFGGVWAMALLGIVLNAIDLKKYSKFSMICYLGMGWCIVLAMKPMLAVLDFGAISLIFWGGVAYTIGAVLFCIGVRVRYMHSIFHLFVLAGSILHFLSIVIYIM